MSTDYHVEQMLQIGTLRGDYLYQIAHLCIILLAESAT